MHDADFICLLEPTRPGMPESPTDDEARVVGEHFAYYRGLQERGVLRLAGRSTEPPVVGIMLMCAGSRERAERIVAGDPAVASGVMRARVQAFRVALA